LPIDEEEVENIRKLDTGNKKWSQQLLEVFQLK
jgi:hypothetical protein